MMKEIKSVIIMCGQAASRGLFYWIISTIVVFIEMNDGSNGVVLLLKKEAFYCVVYSN